MTFPSLEDTQKILILSQFFEKILTLQPLNELSDITLNDTKSTIKANTVNREEKVI